MNTRKQTILALNVSVFFIFASILELTLHECGHFIAGCIMHLKPVLYHNYVNHPIETITQRQRICFAAAGPIVSLLIGIACGTTLRYRNGANFMSLFLLLMAVFGYIGFFGYMAVAPFFTYGDTGFVLEALGAPLWLIVLLAVGSVGALFYVLKGLARFFVSFMSRATAEDSKRRSTFVFYMITVPFFIGMPITTLLNLPVPTFLSLLAPLCSPFSLFWVYHYYITAIPRQRWGYDESELLTRKISVGGVIALVVVVIINRLLVGGFSF